MSMPFPYLLISSNLNSILSDTNTSIAASFLGPLLGISILDIKMYFLDSAKGFNLAV